MAGLQKYTTWAIICDCCCAHSGVALDVWSYSALIKGYVQNSDLKSALELLQEMKQAHNVLPNEVCYWFGLLQFFDDSNVLTQQNTTGTLT